MLTYPRLKRAETYSTFFAPNGWKSIFDYSHSQHLCLICNATIALMKKGNFEQHFKIVYCRRATWGISLPKHLYVPQKNQALTSQLAARQSIFTKARSKASPQLLLPITSVTSLINTRSH